MFVERSLPRLSAAAAACRCGSRRCCCRCCRCCCCCCVCFQQGTPGRGMEGPAQQHSTAQHSTSPAWKGMHAWGRLQPGSACPAAAPATWALAGPSPCAIPTHLPCRAASTPPLFSSALPWAPPLGSWLTPWETLWACNCRRHRRTRSSVRARPGACQHLPPFRALQCRVPNAANLHARSPAQPCSSHAWPPLPSRAQAWRPCWPATAAFP